MLLFEILWVGIAYVLGSVPFGLVLAKRFCNVDPRLDGSHSIGATNVSRLCGFHWGALTLVCDVLKGTVPVWLAMLLEFSPLFITLTAFACVAGHVFSCFLGFKGGKAVATTIGVFLPLAFGPLIISCLLCILVIWRSGYVSLGSICLVLALPILLLMSEAIIWAPLALILMLLVIWRHRENIARLMTGTEKSWLKSKN